MPTLKKAILDLKPFSKHDGIAEILDYLTPFQKNEHLADAEIEGLRKKLRDILSSEPTLNQHPIVTSVDTVENHHFFRSFFNYARNKDITVYDAIYNVLIALAELKPLNDTDPITLDKIKDKNKIFTSTGHQYDINTLIDFHNQRPIGKAEFFAIIKNNKPILNIHTNQPFSLRDIAYIEEFIQTKIKSLGKIKSVEEVNKSKHILQATAAFALAMVPGNYFNPDEDKKGVAVVMLFISLLLYAASLSYTKPQKIEEEPLLNYKPR